jgi:hypothetical protein
MKTYACWSAVLLSSAKNLNLYMSHCCHVVESFVLSIILTLPVNLIKVVEDHKKLFYKYNIKHLIDILIIFVIFIYL